LEQSRRWKILPAHQEVAVRIDADVLAWVKGQGKGYQTRINRYLREEMYRKTKPRSERKRKQRIAR